MGQFPRYNLALDKQGLCSLDVGQFDEKSALEQLIIKTANKLGVEKVLASARVSRQEDFPVVPDKKPRIG